MIKIDKKEDMKEKFELWLHANNLSFIVDDNIYQVDGEYGKWVILVDFPKRGPSQSFSSKLLKAIDLVNETSNKTSLLIYTDNNYVTKFKTFSKYVKETLNISLLCLNKNGDIHEY